jgi:hypothetical protein
LAKICAPHTSARVKRKKKKNLGKAENGASRRREVSALQLLAATRGY